MEWLNYHHLLYFWVVAKEGGLLPAGKVLHVSHPTLSAQIHTLESHLGEKLFVKEGRRLVLTELGRVAFRYAEEIFSLGRELLDSVKGRATGKPLRLNVGIDNAVPKMVARRLLEPALALTEPVRLVCREDTTEKLLAELAMHTVDIVISDSPVPSGSPVRAFTHLLGETTVTFFGAPSLASTCRRKFPSSLTGAPVLLPLENTTLRRALNSWFLKHDVTPRVVAEFEDSALMKVFGTEGIGLFPAPTALEPEIRNQYGVVPVGRIPDIRERFYAISAERKLKNPAVLAITDAARQELFAVRKAVRA